METQIEKELASLNDKVILIGHSLGGSVLLKYLSEEDCKQSISGMFLVAAPYWGKDDWLAEEFTLPENFASKLPQTSKVFLYHNRNDKIVPFSHLEHYEEKLPKAKIQKNDGDERAFSDGLSELVKDIKALY